MTHLDNALSDALEEYRLDVLKRIKAGEKPDIDNLEDNFCEWIDNMISDFCDEIDWDEMREEIKEEQQ